MPDEVASVIGDDEHSDKGGTLYVRRKENESLEKDKKLRKAASRELLEKCQQQWYERQRGRSLDPQTESSYYEMDNISRLTMI